MSVSEYETLYLPSAWSKRLSRDIIVEEHVKICKSYSQETQKQIKHELNLKYGTEEEHVYDIFGTDLPDDAPIFIFIHGGYWQEPSIRKEVYWFIAKNLYKNNIKSIFIEYELCPKVTMPTIVENIQLALKECLKYAESCNTQSIHIGGHSVGAHLATELFEHFIPNLPQTTRNLFRNVFLICGLYDLVPLLQTSINDPLKLNESSAIAYSPLRKKITANETVFHVIAAQCDGPPFVEQAKEMKEHLTKSGVKTNYLLLENIDHFDVLENMYDEDYELLKLFTTKINESA